MRIDIHIHHYNAQGEEILRAIHQLERLIMANKQEVRDALAKANASITGIAADVAALKAKIDANGEVDPDIVADVNALADRLASLDAETPAEEPPTDGG